MFSDKKSCFPPGTFIATPLRVVAIIQLCFAFTLLASYAGYPFMGELYEIKSRMLLLDAVKGSGDDVATKEFSSLPDHQRKEIALEYHTQQQRMQQPAGEKLFRSWNLFSQMPPFEKGWVFFSIVIPILLLLKIEGAGPASWILPLIVLFYGIDNLSHRSGTKHSREEDLFPSEQLIVENYLKEPLNPNILEQKKQLTQGWQSYLVAEWLGEDPSSDAAIFKNQSQRGEFRFNLARINALKGEETWVNPSKPPVMLLAFLLWNLFFAAIIHSKSRNQ